MLKRMAILLVIAGCLSCRAHRPDLLPRSGPHFRSLSIKFNFHDAGTRQNGRVSWRFDAVASKFLFFTPLNQVGMELDVGGEDAMLVNHGKKAFWRGDFSYLLDRLWGIGLSLAELRSLLVAGEVPQAGFAEKGIAASVECDHGSSRPRSILLQQGAAELSLRILQDEYRPGKIELVNYAERYQSLDLESVLNDD